MSELKAFNSDRIYWAVEQAERVAGDIDDLHLDDNLFYIKSEADKVFAELKKEKEYVIENTTDVINGQERELRRQKYKRCLALAQEWRSYATFCGMQSSCHNHRGFGKTAEKYTWKEIHAWKCVKRWLDIADKFKEAK